MSVYIENTENNNSFFPIYDQLYELYGNSNSKLDNEEQNDLLKQLRELDQTASEQIFVIIRIHCLRFHTSSKPFDLPYQAHGEKCNNNDKKQDIKFEIKNLPNNLLRMLMHYCKIHVKGQSQFNDMVME